MTEGKVSVRRQGKGDLGAKLVDEFLQEMATEIKDRVSV
jgi:threonyl-tRNA synthetase